jgi:hypothetical protein
VSGEGARTHERRVRRRAGRHGLSVHRSRAGQSLDNHGGYQLVDADRNWIVAGERFNLTLDDVDRFLDEWAKS